MGTSKLRLDLDIGPGREIQLHQRVECLLGRLEDVEQALVRANLELLARLLVDVRSAKNRVATYLGGERNGARHARSGSLCRLDDVGRRLVEQLVIEGLEADTDFG